MLTLSFRTMLHAAAPAMMLLAGLTVGVEQPDKRTTLAVALLTFCLELRAWLCVSFLYSVYDILTGVDYYSLTVYSFLYSVFVLLSTQSRLIFAFYCFQT